MGDYEKRLAKEQALLASREDADNLKADWLKDPCYDLYPPPEGFEIYAEEFREFQEEKQSEWEKAGRERRFKAQFRELMFPNPIGSENYGISVREYFAAQAIQGAAMKIPTLKEPNKIKIFEEIAANARRIADALVLELADPAKIPEFPG